MAYDYTMASGDRLIKSSEIVAMLDASIPIQAAHIEAVKQLQEKGCRYSNEDFDVLSAAWRTRHRTDIDTYEARWVERMLGEATERASWEFHETECRQAALAVLRERKRRRV